MSLGTDIPKLAIDAPTNVWYKGMKDEKTDAVVTTATVSFRVNSKEDGSGTWYGASVNMPHQSGGDYVGTYPESEASALTPGTKYWVIVTVSGAASDKRSLPHVAGYRRNK